MTKSYYMGLDMGTCSLGWAVTDKEYHLLRAHGKDLWGIRLFETAKTAEERRGFRTNRRRLDRCNRRVQLLQEIFAEEICKVDPGFFLRLKESFYVPEDKRDIEGKNPLLPYSLFVDKDFTDKDYHKLYPTIYHLRKELMESTEKRDVRLVYLALHHLIKHRGHFLFAGIDVEKITDFHAAFLKFAENIKNEELDFNLATDEHKSNIVKEALQNERLSKSSKAGFLIKELGAETKCEKALLKLLSGCKVKLSDIFDNHEYDSNERPQISFSDTGYEDYAGTVESELAEQYYVIESAKAIYDWSVLVNILGNYHTVSEAKVSLYEKHKKDLSYLKKLVKENLTKEEYRKIFVISEEAITNYPAYIGMTKVNGKKVDLSGKRCSKEELYTFLRKNVMDKIEDEGAIAYLKEELELGTFLPKQICRDNGVIPYQLQLLELKAILKNAMTYLPFLEKESEKIEQIFTFRIPYYVGPIHVVKEGQNSFSWAVRRSNEAIYPWNFTEIIDEEASAEQFIRRMTNKCTYLRAEDVLPKESLLYSKFMVLNELNNLKLNGEKISVELKQKLYEDLFKRYRKVTHKRLRDYLVINGICDKYAEITGIDGDFKTSLKSYHDMKEKLTGVTLTDAQKEQIILNVTLFGEDGRLLSKRLKTLFPELSEGQIKAIRTLKYQGWGRLSKEFLDGITAPDLETGEAVTIIRAMWETNNNLMQLLSNQYQFIDAIEGANTEEGDGLTYSAIEKLYVSPAVKRQIWQTVLVVKELQKVMGGSPERVFLEVAREKTDDGRKISRKRQLQDLYKNCKEEERDWMAELENTQEHSLKSDQLFLYYTQKGKCMYCGKNIGLEELWNKNLYDIDHIYPQSKVMDDSIRNRVLVCRNCNRAKEDKYPIAAEIQQKMRPFWKGLLLGKLIDEEKYRRLDRREEFSPEELAGFIERQLVETRQSTKEVARLLKQALPETEIVYVKAKTVSKFRQDFDFIKVRELNDYHHAKDAYLNIVVGNTYYVKFTKDAAKFIERNPGRSYSLNRMFTSTYDVQSNGETAWRVGENGTIQTVRKVMGKNSILFTRKNYETQGGLFDQQLLKKGKGQVPIKRSDERLDGRKGIEKYGGYNKAKGAYFVLVESEDKKGRKKRSIEYIPLYKKAALEQSKEQLLQYLQKECALVNPKVLLERINIDTLFKIDGFLMHLSGRTGQQLVFKNANQLIVSKEQEEVLKRIVKITEQLKMNRGYKINSFDKIEKEQTVLIYQMFHDKLANTVYGKKLGAQLETLEKGEDKFRKLTLEEQCKVLVEILHLFQCTSALADLKLIGGKGNVGMLTLSINLSDNKEIKIIHQSPTGIFEKEIDLSKI